jgi:hypothetical protein
MNLGAEPKKIAMLSGLVLVGGYIFYANVLSSPDTSVRKATVDAPVALAPGAPNQVNLRIEQRKNMARIRSEAFVPKLPVRPEDRPNYATVDPTLRLDLLAKVQAVEPEGGARSLFQFSVAPPPEATLTQVAAIHPKARVYGPPPPPPPTPPMAKPPEPPPPPITLKFYGYSTPRADGQKRAFFLDGDDILIAAEGEMVKKRYRVVQIGVNSVIMEDTQFKNNRQTLILQQEQAG